MFYFQMYEAQKMQKQWNSMLGVSTPSEEENDIVKVSTAHNEWLVIMSDLLLRV